MGRTITLLLLFSAACGCTGSRWAREDPDYAAKYPKHTDNVPRMLKQAVDARHVRGKGGVYASLGANEEPFGMGAEIGGFKYQTPCIETRLGISGLIYEGDQPVSGGVVLGTRLQTPSRLAPFVGVGVYGGLTPPQDASMDGRDNDDDGFVDDADETDNELVVAVTPEVGCHFWLTPAWRITGSANYLVTTAGRDSDFLMFNITLAHLSDLGKMTSQRARNTRAKELGWQVGDGLGASYPK